MFKQRLTTGSNTVSDPEILNGEGTLYINL